MRGTTKLTIVGNLTSTPDLRSTKDGTEVASLTIAVNSRDDTTEFIRCTAWGKQATVIAQYLDKGSPIVAFCSDLSLKSFEMKDGNTRYYMEARLNDFNFIGGKKDGDRPLKQHEVLEKARDVAPDEVSDGPIDLSEIPL